MPEETNFYYINVSKVSHLRSFAPSAIRLCNIIYKSVAKILANSHEKLISPIHHIRRTRSFSKGLEHRRELSSCARNNAFYDESHFF